MRKMLPVMRARPLLAREASISGVQFWEPSTTQPFCAWARTVAIRSKVATVKRVRNERRRAKLFIADGLPIISSIKGYLNGI
jgi:hypothetical protein